MHDASKILMGTTRSSDKPAVSSFNSDPATFVAGLAVRRASTGGLSVAKAAGEWAGISLGKDLGNSKNTAVARLGSGIPMLLELAAARGVIEITSYANLVSGTDDSITVGATVFTAQEGAVTPGGATFQAASSNAATATSLAAQINAHAVAGLLVNAVADGAEVTLIAKANTTAGNAIALAYTDNDTNVGATVSGETLEGGGAAPDYVVQGEHVWISDVTGKADDAESGASISNAIYASSEVFTGIAEDGTEVAVALVDAIGGL